MKLPTRQTIHAIITAISFVVFMTLLWYLKPFHPYGYDTKNYDKKADKPNIKQIEFLLNELTENLPKPYHDSTIKPELISKSHEYINLTPSQKIILSKNIKSQPKWVYYNHKTYKQGYDEIYCYDQFTLIISNWNFDYSAINKGFGEQLSVYVRWGVHDDCRKQFLNNTKKQNHPKI